MIYFVFASSQFLPQDKVSEFAQMSNIELLKATQRAAGATQLSEWHEKLIQLKTEEKQLGSVSGRF